MRDDDYYSITAKLSPFKIAFNIAIKTDLFPICSAMHFSKQQVTSCVYVPPLPPPWMLLLVCVCVCARARTHVCVCVFYEHNEACFHAKGKRIITSCIASGFSQCDFLPTMFWGSMAILYHALTQGWFTIC